MKQVSTKWMKQLVVVLMAMMMLTLAACGNGTENAGKNTNGSNAVEQGSGNTQQGNADDASKIEEQGTEDAAQTTTYPITVKDATGTDVVLEAEPKAVVSIVPSETEIVFAVGGGERVVGVDEYSNYPEEVASIAKVGDMNTNIEAVTALNPDLVLASSSMNGEAITKLRELGLTVFASDPLTYDDTVAHIEQIAVLLNTQAAGQEVVNGMKQAKQEIVDKLAGVEPRKVYLEFSPGWTVGSGTFLDDLVTTAGGVNIANSQPGWYEVDGEAVVAQNPAVIIYPDFGEEQSSILAGIKTRPGWEVIDAVKNERLVMVSNDPLVRVGPRLVQGLQEIAAAIHPELFQ